MSEAQYGFAKGKGTSEPIITLINVLEHARKTKDSPKPVWVGFVDLKKAYDSVEHWLIREVLEFYSVDTELIQAIMSCYEGDKAFIRTSFGNTKLFDVTRGVRQGDVLSPLLFNITMNPFYTYMGNNHTGYLVSPEVEVNTLAFVDDICLVANNQPGLEDMINQVDAFCAYSGMEINVQKTDIITNDKTCSKVTIQLDRIVQIAETIDDPAEKAAVLRNASIISDSPSTRAVKYLGIWLTAELNWEKALKVAAASFKAKLTKIQSKRFPIEIKAKIVNIIINKGLEYTLNFTP